MNDIFADGDDEHREKMRRLTPEQRGQLITDQVAPRSYSWLKNPDGMTYLHEHGPGESPPGSAPFIHGPDSMAARTTHGRDPLWYARGVPDDD
jgi:hypothetical protein